MFQFFGGRTSSGNRANSQISGATGGGYRTAPNSNTGGSTRLGSGPTRAYGGGRYYGGGAATPYKPGTSSPRAGLLAVPLVGAALIAYPGLYLYGAYAYPYHNPYSYRNRSGRRNQTITTSSAVPTATNLPRLISELVERQTSDGVEEMKPVTCVCDASLSCGCDEPEDINAYLSSLIGDGNYATMNHSLINIADINGTSTIVISGTLPNGTTAPGGVDDASDAMRTGSVAGYAVLAALVGFSVFLV